MNGDRPFLVLGHRGSPQRFPENSIASLRGALAEGADGFETDLRLLADRSVVLFHDDEVDGRAVEGIGRTELEQLRGLVAGAEELREFVGQTRMVLEIKRAGWEGALLELIAGWGAVVISSFDHCLIRRLADEGYPGELGIIFNGTLHEAGRYAVQCGARWLFPHYRHVDRSSVEQARDHDLRIVPWTPNREEEWARLADAGCDGIISDLPREAVQWREQRRESLC